MLSIQLLEGRAAVLWAQENQQAWNTLLKKCEWGTSYISPEFSITWWSHYAQDGQALVVFAWTNSGELRVRTANELEAVFDEIVAAYELRQGAQYDLMRFTDDPLKAPFYLAWMRQAPEQLYVTTMTLNGRVAAALVCARSQGELHLAISCYRPELSAHSPGKLLIYETARLAAADGLHLLDLTPGGDGWKDSMATDRKPAVEAVSHATSLQAQMRRPRAYLRSALRNALWNRGLPPHLIKQQTVGWLRQLPERLALRLVEKTGFRLLARLGGKSGLRHRPFDQGRPWSAGLRQREADTEHKRFISDTAK